MVDRMCIVTRKVLDESELVRFVLSPDGVVTPDLARKLPGRGVWVSLSRETLAEAIKRKGFNRGFGDEVKTPDDLADVISKQLRQQAVATLSLARKAGEALAGYIRVEEAMGKGPIRLLLHAQGSSADGARKLNRLAQPETLIFNVFSSDEMDLAFGRANVVHACVAAGGLAEKLVFHLSRWARFESLNLEPKGRDLERHDEQQ